VGRSGDLGTRHDLEPFNGNGALAGFQNQRSAMR
jgi:hypothetical protein